MRPGQLCADNNKTTIVITHMAKVIDEKSTLSFEFDEEEGRLTVNLKHIKGDTSFDADKIKNQLSKDGYGHLFVLEDAILHLVNSQSRQTSQVSLVVAERRDAEVTISLSDDHMQAFMSITRAYGGEPASLDLANEHIRRENISFGLKEEVIKQLLERGTATDELIAEGRPEIDGEDTQFESLIPDIQSRTPTINEDGTTNYRDINQFITVSKGDALMRKHPPTKGTTGTDVMGKVIHPRAGVALNFSPVLQGVEIDSANSNTLIATQGGQPILVDHGVIVEPIIQVKKVDLSTGNINFDGSVDIKGDVTNGMIITATADVMVSGTVEAAQIHAGGNVIVKQGIIGHGELRQESGELSNNAAVIEAVQSIQAKFVENAWLKARDSITIDEQVTHSEMYCLNQINVGGKNSKNGHIIGGLTQTTLRVEAQTLGSPGSVKTIIETGGSPDLRAALKIAKKNLTQKEFERKKGLLLLEHLKSNNIPDNSDIMKQTLMTLDKLNIDVDVSFDECERIELQIEQTKNARIIVARKIFNNVQIKVANQHKEIDEEKGPGTFSIKEGEISYE